MKLARAITAFSLACLLAGCTGQEAPREARRSEAVPDVTEGATEEVVAEALSDTIDATAEGTDDSTGAGAVAAPASEAGAAEVAESPPEEETPSADAVAAGSGARPVVSPSGLRVLRAYVCKGIEQSEPTEAGKSFLPEDDGVLRLCCFSEIAGASDDETIYHVWYWGDREMARVELAVQSSRWRTWSTKRVLDEWKGEWHVDVVDRNGFVLESLEFSVE